METIKLYLLGLKIWLFIAVILVMVVSGAFVLFVAAMYFPLVAFIIFMLVMGLI